MVARGSQVLQACSNGHKEYYHKEEDNFNKEEDNYDKEKVNFYRYNSFSFLVAHVFFRPCVARKFITTPRDSPFLFNPSSILLVPAIRRHYVCKHTCLQP